MADFDCKIGTFQTTRRNAVLSIAFSGMINTATFPEFQTRAGKAITKDTPRVVFDLEKLSYINSSGLGELIRFQDTCRENGGDLVLIRVPADIIRTIRIIGFHTIIKIFPDRNRAAVYFDTGAEGEVAREYARVAPKPAPSGKARPAKPFKKVFPRTPIDASIMLVTPERNIFSDILEMRWGGGGGKFTLSRDRSAVVASLAAKIPDLIIIDDTVGEADELCRELKLSKESNMSGLIRLYSREPHTHKGLRVLENERISEPFEYNELFAVSEGELKKTADEKKYVVHQISLEFPSNEDSLSAANDMISEVIRHADYSEFDASELRTAVREAIDNAFKHGNKREESKPIRIECLLDNEKAAILITDSGNGFDYEYYLNLSKSADPQERARMRQRDGKQGGLGIMLMMRCLDDLNYFEGGHVCRLTKKYS